MKKKWSFYRLFSFSNFFNMRQVNFIRVILQKSKKQIQEEQSDD